MWDYRDGESGNQSQTDPKPKFVSQPISDFEVTHQIGHHSALERNRT